jgi:3-phenylpropionate/trans-cinnamate dioxygenase ferredoxin reductase component
LATPAFVIVGGGLAGATAAATLRSEGFEGKIVIIGDEPHIPYTRPPLSKAVLRGEMEEEKTWLRPPSWYEERDVDLRLGVAATSFDAATHTVELANGDEVPYDKLLLAMGGRPRTLDLPGADLPGVMTLRTLDDSWAIREHLSNGAPIVVVGAGFIGAEVAASARMMGCDVTMLEIAEIPMGRVLGPELGHQYAALHRERGVNLRTGVGIDAIEGDGRAQRVVASDGQVHDAAIVVIGVGLVPSVEMAEVAGLDTGNGVVVNECCETSAPDVYAVGDLANHPNPFLGRNIRVEHWQNAQHQAEAAAKNMLGKHHPFHEVPWVWSDQYEFNLQVVGLPDPGDDVVVRGEPETHEYSAFFLKDGKLRAALGVNRPLDVRAARLMVQRSAEPDVEQLRDVDSDLNEQVPPKPE